MSTENIQKFLMPPDEGGAYTDEKLAAILAHAQDGKLSYFSCCCLVGSVTARHPLRGLIPESTCDWGEDISAKIEAHHIQIARRLPSARKAEEEFRQLAYDTPQPFRTDGSPANIGFALKEDAKRRERLIPLILAEMERRERNKIEYIPDEEPWTDSKTTAEMMNSIKGR